MGEVNLIANEKNKLKIPYNLGIIISNQEFNSIYINLLKIINWSINLGIKEIILYDPFNIISEENISNFKENLNIFFSKNTKDIYLFKNNKFCYHNSVNENISKDICINYNQKFLLEEIDSNKKDYNKSN